MTAQPLRKPPTRRTEQIELAINYLKSRPDKYAKFVSDDPWQRVALEALVGHALDNISARRTPSSKLMVLTGTETRAIVRTDDENEAVRYEELIKAIEAGASAIYNRIKRYQRAQRRRKKGEASEMPVTKSGQIRLI
jgi:hypothetical protein